MNQNYYSIEGLGGIGKTTFLRALPSNNFSKFEEISKENKTAKDIKKFSDKREINLRGNNYFLKKELIRMENFSKTKSNILDRGIYSQIVYNYAKFRTYGQRDIFYLIEKLKNLEKKGFSYPKIIYLSCNVDFSIKSLLKKKGISSLDRTDEENFIRNAKKCYDKLFAILGRKNALKIKVPYERETSLKKLHCFIENFGSQQINFSIKEIEKFCTE